MAGIAGRSEIVINLSNIFIYYYYCFKDKATVTDQIISRMQALINLDGMVGGRYNLKCLTFRTRHL